MLYYICWFFSLPADLHLFCAETLSSDILIRLIAVIKAQMFYLLWFDFIHKVLSVGNNLFPTATHIPGSCQCPIQSVGWAVGRGGGELFRSKDWVSPLSCLLVLSIWPRRSTWRRKTDFSYLLFSLLHWTDVFSPLQCKKFSNLTCFLPRSAKASMELIGLRELMNKSETWSAIVFLNNLCSFLT